MYWYEGCCCCVPSVRLVLVLGCMYLSMRLVFGTGMYVLGYETGVVTGVYVLGYGYEACIWYWGVCT